MSALQNKKKMTNYLYPEYIKKFHQSLIKIQKSIFIFLNTLKVLFLAILSLRSCMGLSLVASSGGYSLISVLGLLIAVAALLVEYGLQGTRASVVAALGLNSCGSQALECWLSPCGTRTYGLNPYLLHWQADSLPLSYMGSPTHISNSFIAM